MKILTTECGTQFQVKEFQVGQTIVKTSDFKPVPDGRYILSDESEDGTPFQVTNGKISKIIIN